MSHSHLHTQTVRVTAFEQDVQSPTEKLCKVHVQYEPLEKQLQAEPDSQRMEQLVLSGSRGSHLTQQAKIKDVKPGL